MSIKRYELASVALLLELNDRQLNLNAEERVRRGREFYFKRAAELLDEAGQYIEIRDAVLRPYD